jgi:hypothetical protein
VVQVRARHVGVDQHGDDEAAEGRLRQRLGEHQVGERVAVAAAVLALEHQAEQAGGTELPQHLARRVSRLLPRQGVRLDLAGDEAGDLIAQQLVLGREVDALHRGPVDALPVRAAE